MSAVAADAARAALLALARAAGTGTGLAVGDVVPAQFVGWRSAAAGQLVAEVEIAGQRLMWQAAAGSVEPETIAAGDRLLFRLAQAPQAGQPLQAELVSRNVATASAPLSEAAPPDLARLAGLSAREVAAPLLGQALARQQPLGPLFASLAALAAPFLALPRGTAVPVSRQTAAVLAALAPALSAREAVQDPQGFGERLARAVAQSGVFHDRLAVAGQGETAARDLKGALTLLKSVLAEGGAPADAEPPPAAGEPPSREQGARQPAMRDAAGREGARAPAADFAPPPRRDAGPVPQGLVAADDAGQALPSEARIEAALDRIRLAQFASLPSPADPAQPGAQPVQRLVVELPMLLAGGALVLPLEIEREPPGRTAAAEAAGPVWRLRFALDLEPFGPLHAGLTLAGGSLDITLWAEHGATAALLRQAAPDLMALLAGGGAGGILPEASLEVREGRPSRPVAGEGHFLDRRT